MREFSNTFLSKYKNNQVIILVKLNKKIVLVI